MSVYYDPGRWPLLVVPGKEQFVPFSGGGRFIPVAILPVICILHVCFGDRAYGEIT